MLFTNIVPIFITLLLLPQVFVHGGFVREFWRKFKELFKASKPRSPKPGPFYDNCDLCFLGPCIPIVWPSNDNFDGSVDAEAIYNALKGNTLNDNQKATAANILVERSAPQRAAIAVAFKKKNNKPIIDLLDDKVTSVYKYYMFMKDMSLPLPQYFSSRFQFAIDLQSSYSKEFQYQGRAMLVEMLTTLPKCLMSEVIKSFSEADPNRLISAIDFALGKVGMTPEYRELIKKLFEQKRDANQHVSWKKALIDAYKLKSAVIARRETEMKEKFYELFIRCSIPQIIETIVVYENLRHGEKEFKSFADDIDKYMGVEKEVYEVMARVITNKPLYYAESILGVFKSRALVGYYGDRLLVYLLLGRYDIDLKNIIDAYNQQPKANLNADLEAWNKDTYAAAFQPIVLNILEKASRIPPTA